MPYEAKTQETDASVDDFLTKVEPARKRQDAFELLDMMSEITGLPPKMWGPSIVGFGSYHYRYDSGHEGDAMLTGFSPRKRALTLYIMSGYEDWEDLTDRLGKFKTGKACLYINKLDDVDREVLKEIIERSFNHMSATNPSD